MPPKKTGRGRKKEKLSVEMNGEGTENPMPMSKKGNLKAKKTEHLHLQSIPMEETPMDFNSNGLENVHDEDEIEPPPAKKRGKQRNIPQQSSKANEKNDGDAVGVGGSAEGEEADAPLSSVSQATGDQKPSPEILGSQEKADANKTISKKGKGRVRRRGVKSVEAIEKNGGEAVRVDESAEGEDADEPLSNEGVLSQATRDQKPSQENLDFQEKLEQEPETKENASKIGKGRTRRQNSKSVDVPKETLQTKPEIPPVGQESNEKIEQDLESKETASKKAKGRTRRQDSKTVDLLEATQQTNSEIEIAQEGQDSNEKLDRDLESRVSKKDSRRGKGRAHRQDMKPVDDPEDAQQTKPEIPLVGRNSNKKLGQEIESKDSKKGKGRARKQDSKSVDVPEQTESKEVSQVGQESNKKLERGLETKETTSEKVKEQADELVDVPSKTKPEISQADQDFDEKPDTKETTSKKGNRRFRKQEFKSVSLLEVAEEAKPKKVHGEDQNSDEKPGQETTSKKTKGRKQENAITKPSAPVIESRGGRKRKAEELPLPAVETKFLQVSLLRQKSVDDMALKETKKAKESKAAVGSAKPGRKRGREGGDDAVSKPSKAAKASPSSLPKGKKIPDVSALDFSNTSTTKSGEAWNLKIASWNINGIRAWLEKEGASYLREERPDVLCVQETKCSKEKLPKEANVEGYHCYWLAGDKDGYSGVGLLTKQEPMAVEYGIGMEEHDNEGRVVTADFDKFYLVAAYVPNAGRGLVRLEYRKQWDIDFRSYLKKLDKAKPVILCGDLNVAHKEIDLANPKTNKKNAGFTLEEREGFSSLLSEGFVDAYRVLYPDKEGAYTFWTYMMNARAKNVGWRLDYFVISERFADRVCDCCIRSEVMGSDHCPLVLFLNV